MCISMKLSVATEKPICYVPLCRGYGIVRFSSVPKAHKIVHVDSWGKKVGGNRLSQGSALGLSLHFRGQLEAELESSRLRRVLV